ncbi:hypothetical protein ADUPG1_004252, partial [Aduncisulcus paluster]
AETTVSSHWTQTSPPLSPSPSLHSPHSLHSTSSHSTSSHSTSSHSSPPSSSFSTPSLPTPVSLSFQKNYIMKQQQYSASKSPPLASQSSHSSHSQHTSPLHTSPLHPSPLHTSPLVPHHEQAQESHHAALHREFSSPINGAHGMHMSPPHGFASLPNPRQPYHNDRGSIV